MKVLSQNCIMWLRVWIKLYIHSQSVYAGQLKLQFCKIMKVKVSTSHMFWVVFWEGSLLAHTWGEGRSTLKQIWDPCWPPLHADSLHYTCLTVFWEKPWHVKVKNNFRSIQDLIVCPIRLHECSRQTSLSSSPCWCPSSFLLEMGYRDNGCQFSIRANKQIGPSDSHGKLNILFSLSALPKPLLNDNKEGKKEWRA